MNLSLAEAIFWIAAIACVAAQLALLRSSFRIKKDDKSDLVPGSPRLMELAWAILPALALSLLLVVTWRRIAELEGHQHVDHPAAGPTAVRDAPQLPAPGI